MPVDAILAFALFAFVTSITPGPNNLMLLASGVNYGLRRSVPHILGIGIGFTVMVLSVGLGLAEVFDRLPWLYSVLRWVGAGYLLYLAWSIANSGPPAGDTDTSGGVTSAGAGAGASTGSRTVDTAARPGPMGFWSAAAFQWVNPKAWVMAVGAFSTYVPAHPSTLLVAGVAVLFGVINIPSVGTWALSGAALRRALQVERTRRLFNIGMAALLVLSLVPLLK